MNFCTRICILLAALFGVATGAFAQAAWWEPERPIAGQPVTIYYDTRTGTLPDGAPIVRLHWGVYNPSNGNWTRPPQAMWPAGSVLQGDSVAVQTPMISGGDSTFHITLTPIDTTLRYLAFVFTTGTQWDNNNNQNWNISYVSGGTVAWWSPDSARPRDVVTIYYNPLNGTLPDTTSRVILHWGINESSPGSWAQPPQSIWPPNTTSSGTGAVQTRLVNHNGIWSASIPTNDTIRSIHFVFTDGTRWDNNNGQNWNIWLVAQVLPQTTWHNFILDTRSSSFVSPVGTITRVNVAGTFNNWSSTAWRMNGPDSLGVYRGLFRVPAGSSQYKLVLNGSFWMNDPENPRYEPSSFHNNLMFATLDTLPYVNAVSPREGFPLPGTQVPVRIEVLPGANSRIRWNPLPQLMVNGVPVTVSALPDSNLLIGTANVTPSPRQIWTLTVSDSVGRTRTKSWETWLRNAAFPGLEWLDQSNDVELNLPMPLATATDLRMFHLSELANGDSILMEVEMGAIHDSTRILVHIGSETAGDGVATPTTGAEMATPEWNGTGIQFVLCNPTSSRFDAQKHNRLITRREPLTFGANIPVTVVNNAFRVTLPVAGIEAVLGSWNGAWSFGAFSYLGTTSSPTGDAVEIPVNWGGNAELIDPDAVDLLVAPSRELQQRLLGNWSGNHLAVMDNQYRGFLRVLPSQVGPNVGSTGPQVRMLSRGISRTVRPNWTLRALTSGTVTARRFYQNGSSIPFTTSGDTIDATVTLVPGANSFYAEADNAQGTSRSAEVIYVNASDQGPFITLVASVAGNTGTLNASQTTDPTPGDIISYQWSADTTNPSVVTITNSNQAIATITRPTVNGEYYFDLRATDLSGNVRKARTFFRVWDGGWNAFELNEAAWWLNDMLLYEIFPRNYSAQGNIAGITADLDRIQSLGFNTIWLTPIFPGPSEHGYAITDYFGIEEDYGTEADFREFMRQAKARHLRVILDMVANHTALQHPYMQDAIRFGRFSPYWNFYDRNASGAYTYYYDWTSLPNVNVSNPDVIDYFVRFAKYWIEEYGVDGYRCDVAWGPDQRNGEFWRTVRRELKKIKPEAFFLAESDASNFGFFDYKFDSAMDWNLHHALPGSFQNMFPGPPTLQNVTNAITNFGVSYPGYKYPFRFMENFDETRYISVKTPGQTRAAASLLLTIGQIPMIYAGQEIGMTSQRGSITWSADPNNMMNTYRPLLLARSRIPALRVSNYEPLTNSSTALVLSYGRNLPGESKVVTVVNFSPTSQFAQVTIPASWALEPDSTYYINDLFTNFRTPVLGRNLTTITTSVNGQDAKVFVISTQPFLTGVTENPAFELPYTTTLHDAYPNPFNATVRVPFDLARGGEYSIAIFDVLGRQMKTVAAGNLRPGRHEAVWNGTNDAGLPVASGVYFVRLNAPGGFSAVKRVALVR